MALDFHETILERAGNDTEFHRGLVVEAYEALIRKEYEVAEILLHDYIEAVK